MLPKETFVQVQALQQRGPRFQQVSPRQQGAVTAAPPLREQSRFAGRLGGTRRSPPRGYGRSLGLVLTPATSESPRGALQIGHCAPTPEMWIQYAGWSPGTSFPTNSQGPLTPLEPILRTSCPPCHPTAALGAVSLPGSHAAALRITKLLRKRTEGKGPEGQASGSPAAELC